MTSTTPLIVRSDDTGHDKVRCDIHRRLIKWAVEFILGKSYVKEAYSKSTVEEGIDFTVLNIRMRLTEYSIIPRRSMIISLMFVLEEAHGCETAWVP